MGTSQVYPEQDNRSVVVSSLEFIRLVFSKWNESSEFTILRESDWDSTLIRAKRVGLAALFVIFMFYLWWSEKLVHHGALLEDFSHYYQAFVLIGHGFLDPILTTGGRNPDNDDQGSLIIWPLAVLMRLWSNPLSPLIFQDLAAVGAMAVVLTWTCEELSRRMSSVPKLMVWIAVFLPLVLMAFNPWILWSLLYPFHLEVLGTFFALLAAHSLWKGSNRVWLYVILCFLCGDVIALYVAAIGFGAIIAGRRWAMKGIGLVVASLMVFLIIASLHLNAGSGGTGTYSHLWPAGFSLGNHHRGIIHELTYVLTHPWGPIKLLWKRRESIFSNLLPGGGVGVFLPWSFPMVTMLTFVNGLTNSNIFIRPGFQNVPTYFFVPLGTALFCVGLITSKIRIRRVAGFALIGLAALNAIVWGLVWFPASSYIWINVTPSAAHQILLAEQQIPPNNEVVVSQGIIGLFAGREYAYSDHFGINVPIKTQKLWVVIAPRQGIETQSVASADLTITELSALPNVSLIREKAGVWLFLLRRRSEEKVLSLSRQGTKIGAWIQSGPAGTPIRNGPSVDWYLSSNGKSGYVLDHDYFYRDPGHYVAEVSLSNSGPVDVEVWNSSTDRLLSRDYLVSSDLVRKVDIPVAFKLPSVQPSFRGWGIWKIESPPYYGDQLEIRIFSPGGSRVKVVSTFLSGKSSDH